MSSFPQAQPGRGLLPKLRSRGAAQWYAGTIFGLAYQAFEVVGVWTSSGPLVHKIVATALLAVFYTGYVLMPPILWAYSWQVRITVITVFWLASFAIWPFIGVNLIWVWPLVGAVIAFCWMPFVPSIVLCAAIVGTQFLIVWAHGFADGVIFAPFVTVTVLISLFGITRQIMANHQLREAQATIASLAVEEERARMARDLHDILGHSLTVVTVKAELAGRLVDRDPRKALAEIRDVERLAREALADLRATVSHSREANLASELASARTALAAANIEAHVPVDADTVDPTLRPVFGWVVREGVTNVIRHSRARSCWVELGPDRLTIADDGVGAGDAEGTSAGIGLRGLGERVAAAGLTLAAGTRPVGGFQLSVARESGA